MKIGDFNSLKVARDTAVGLFLENESGMEVLLPKRYIPTGVSIGDSVRVFVYRDSEDRVIATTETPLATVNNIARLRVKEVSDFGAFLDWGLSKDLFVPLKEQSPRMKPGELHFVYVYLDSLTQRLVATMRIEKHLSNQPVELQKGDEVKALIWKHHDLGFQVIVDHKFLGLIYRNQNFEHFQVGDQIPAYVNAIREDGKIDLITRKPGYVHVDDAAAKVLDALAMHNGFLPLTDKSAPTEIQQELGMSKKSFKKAAGSLYKQRKIAIEEKGLRLL